MDPEMGLGQKVTITSANSLVGRGLLGLLAGTPAETFALVRRPVELPADHLISGWMTSGAAAGAITDAGVVVHLSGEISAGRRPNTTRPTWRPPDASPTTCGRDSGSSSSRIRVPTRTQTIPFSGPREKPKPCYGNLRPRRSSSAPRSSRTIPPSQDPSRKRSANRSRE